METNIIETNRERQIMEKRIVKKINMETEHIRIIKYHIIIESHSFIYEIQITCISWHLLNKYFTLSLTWFYIHIINRQA